MAGKLFHEMIKRSKIPVEALGGPIPGSDPIVTAIFIVSYLETAPIPAFIIRKEFKKHGKSLWIEGDNNLKPGTNVAVVEDVVTAGETIPRAIEIGRAQGLQVVQVLALADREEGARENLAKEGDVLESIFTKSNIL